MNIDKAYIACLYGNNAEEFFIRPLERDLETEEDLIAEEKYFWEEKVLKKVEPDYVEKADLVIASIKSIMVQQIRRPQVSFFPQRIYQGSRRI